MYSFDNLLIILYYLIIVTGVTSCTREIQLFTLVQARSTGQQAIGRIYSLTQPGLTPAK